MLAGGSHLLKANMLEGNRNMIIITILWIKMKQLLLKILSTIIIRTLDRTTLFNRVKILKVNSCRPTHLSQVRRKIF